MLKEKIISYYEKNEVKVDLSFFVAGFIFDILTLSEIDDPLSIAQQICYLFLTGFILYIEFLEPLQLTEVPKKYPKFWHYRALIFHFLLGSLLSVYSLFYLKSASIFSSILFVLIILGLMVANELKVVQNSKIDIKLGLYIICVFSFFSMMFPVLLGFVGIIPFLLAIGMTFIFIYLAFKILLKKINDKKLLLRKLFIPTSTVLSLFLVLYLVGWIPPVPLSIQNMGIYHLVEKKSGQYIVSHEKPWFKFWQNGDQYFQAEPDDSIYFFAKIYSPRRFSDSVFLNWSYNDPRKGWVSSDRIPLHISGGRQGGFRGFAMKKNFQDGEWKISVQTTDEREIGRLYFDVKKVEKNFERKFQQDIF